MSYKVKLRSFVGPFDLLVYLIENAQMNIYDIAIAEITAQYLAYLDEMKKLDVTIGSEFLVLAAQLIEIKSKMLIPRTTEIDGTVVTEDPRSELVERLVEYRMFKEASEMLSEQAEYTSRIFEKPQEDISEYLDAPDEYISLDVTRFVNAFNLFINKKQRVEQVRKKYVRVKRERESTESRKSYIRSIFKTRKLKSIHFSETLVDARDKYDVVLSFTSLLEMIKERDVMAEQKEMYGDIVLTSLEEKDD